MAKILQLKISLQGIKPPIWRRFTVKDSISFDKLHRVIQEVMGWEGYHLFEFDQGGLSIGTPDEGYSDEIQDAKKIKICQFLNAEGQRMPYTYDFGDCWEHTILVEKILKDQDTEEHPICIAGKRASPPEDSGGAWGYEEMLEIQKDKSHPEYEERIVDWLGENFDPEEFDIEGINKRLAMFRKVSGSRKQPNYWRSA